MKDVGLELVSSYRFFSHRAYHDMQAGIPETPDTGTSRRVLSLTISKIDVDVIFLDTESGV